MRFVSYVVCDALVFHLPRDTAVSSPPFQRRRLRERSGTVNPGGTGGAEGEDAPTHLGRAESCYGAAAQDGTARDEGGDGSGARVDAPAGRGPARARRRRRRGRDHALRRPRRRGG